MKKQITFATLLVASTLLANAAGPITMHGITFDDSTEVSAGSVNTQLNGKGSYAVKVSNSPGGTGGFTFSGPAFNNNQGLLWITSTGAYSANNAIGVGSLKVDSGVTFTAGVAVAGVFGGNGTIRVIGNGFLDVNSNTNQKVDVSGMDAGARIFLNERGLLNVNSSIPGVTPSSKFGTNHKNISLNLLSADAATGVGGYSVIGGDVAGVSLVTRTIIQGGGIDGLLDLVSISFGDLNMKESDKELLASDATVENLGSYFLNYSGGALTVSYIASASSIPEPSTFGLLAGLGALALVASRRRRSRKAA